MSTLIDPEFKYHQVTARIWTEITMVLADSVILPFNVTHYGVNMKYYNKHIKNKFKDDFANYTADKDLGTLLLSILLNISHFSAHAA